jgi:hydrogenase nickel incorporation protein HypB
MCTTCGCGHEENGVTFTKIGEEQHHHHHANGHDHHHHGHDHHHHHHEHEHHSGVKDVVELERDIHHKNNLMAERNRGYLEAKNILALNLLSSPGSGKTSLLERTIEDMKERYPFFVIEGDQQTSNDANRIAATGAEVVQINTGKGCHLDADMVHKAIHQLKPTQQSLLMIENVGNLVCPAMFDLGEGLRVVIISVTEGDDKPIKYPDMFHTAHLCIINKIDLLPYVQFDVEKTKDYARQVNHHLEFLELSATSGEGLKEWYAWLESKMLVSTE